MDLDLALRIEKIISILDNLQERFGALFLRVKGRGNIREYIMEMSNLVTNLKSLKLELSEDLIVYLVLISLPTHFGQFKLYLTMCKRKKDCREIRLKVFILLRSLRIRGRTLWILRKDVFKSFKAEVELQLGKKIKSSNLIVVVNTMVDKMDKENNVQSLLPFFSKNVELFFFETGNVRILKEVEFKKEENIRNVVFEEESVNDIGQVLMLITIQEITQILPQTPIEQPQQPQEVSLRRSIKERRHAILDDYLESKDNIERYKARLVAKGFTQKEGINYKETFSLNYNDIVDHFDLELHQMDVKNAFLNGDIDETIYIV
ncbi:Copia protein, partial [Mucuna pruriens]